MEKTLKSELRKALEEAKVHIDEAIAMPLTADAIVAIQRRIDAVLNALSWVRQTVVRLKKQSEE